MVGFLELDADRSSVGSPVDVVIIVGQELLGEVGFGDRLGLTAAMARLGSLLEAVEDLLSGSRGCWWPAVNWYSQFSSNQVSAVV